jgi:hypothetical protein
MHHATDNIVGSTLMPSVPNLEKHQKNTLERFSVSLTLSSDIHLLFDAT